MQVEVPLGGPGGPGEFDVQALGAPIGRLAIRNGQLRVGHYNGSLGLWERCYNPCATAASLCGLLAMDMTYSACFAVRFSTLNPIMVPSTSIPRRVLVD